MTALPGSYSGVSDPCTVLLTFRPPGHNVLLVNLALALALPCRAAETMEILPPYRGPAICSFAVKRCDVIIQIYKPHYYPVYMSANLRSCKFLRHQLGIPRESKLTLTRM